MVSQGCPAAYSRALTPELQGWVGHPVTSVAGFGMAVELGCPEAGVRGLPGKLHSTLESAGFDVAASRL